MSYVEKTNLANVAGTTINPATAELQEVYVMLRQLLTAIAYPNTVDRSANAQRTTITNIPTVSISGAIGTVTTVTGITNLDGYQAKMPVINNNTAAWALACRARIS